MKVLIVSHNVISRTDNMGKTLLSHFKDFNTNELAQFYIHSEVPTDGSVCRNYYRFTDTDALKSIIPLKKRGRIFTAGDIETGRGDTRTDEGLTGDIYQLGRARTGLIYLARNTMWRMSRWFTEELKSWLLDFSPDVIFFASGDYAFLYRIVIKMSDFLKVPVVCYCCDDYYIYNPNSGSLIGRAVHRNLVKTAKKLFSRSLFGVAICRSMAEEYEKLFNTPFKVLYTGAEDKKLPPCPQARQISYLGNLSYDRDKQLVMLGRALKSLDRQQEPRLIHVYSGEKNPESLALMTEENGICFHGRIAPEEVLSVMSRSMAVIHTESFNRKFMEEIRFSVSTKIAESLMYGPCLIAYGPEGIASIDYLRENDCAFVMTEPEELAPGLERLIASPELRSRILSRARETAEKNHRGGSNSLMLRKWTEEALRERG